MRTNQLTPISSVRTSLLLRLGLFLTLLTTVGCQGDLSTETPVHLNPNMDEQNRMDPQSTIPGTDESSMRLPVEGTMIFKAHPEDATLYNHLYKGLGDNGYVAQLPSDDPHGNTITLDESFLERGQERYDIYCTPCHDSAGTGNGVVIQRYRAIEEKEENWSRLAPPSFHQEKYRSMPIGQFFSTMTNGFGNMGSYAAQVGVRDRWAIAAYIRVLQVSQLQDLTRVPADKAASHRWEIR